DAGRCGAVVVTKAETTPVNESIELISAIHSVDVALAGAIVNAVEPDVLLINLSEKERSRLPAEVAELIDAAIARHQQSRHNIGRFVDALGNGVMEVERLATADLNRDLVATLATAAYGEPVS
ncbi:MAG: hypothetical protein ACO2Y6_10175, partial [Ilumatobacteraceae bacterium]